VNRPINQLVAKINKIEVERNLIELIGKVFFGRAIN
jgi:hypothetical protein